MLSKKMKIWISIVTAFAIMMAGVVVWLDPFVGTTVSAEGQYRNGYLLIPEEYDLYGVSIDSKFTLLTLSEHTLEQVLANFFIDGEPKPTIEKRSATKFVITPAKPLEPNKIYTFRMQKNGYEDITWSFQTGYPFGIVSSLPAHRSTWVPINTGIEITFNLDGYQDIDSFFSITPSVPGKFERHGSTAVFVPEKELEYGTLYTVTLKKGLPLEGSDKVLQEDFVFSFETQPQETSVSIYDKGWFSFTNVLNDAASDEAPFIPVYYYIYNRYGEKTPEDMTVEAEIYSYGNVQKFLDALKEKDKVPTWASYSYQNNLLSEKGLNKVMSFKQVFPAQNKTEEDNFLRLPEKLPKGFYLVNAKWEDRTFQTLLQVTDIGVYSVVTDKEALVWLNTVGSGRGVNNATVQAVGTASKVTSDENGIAKFNPDILNVDEETGIAYMLVTKGGDNTVIRYENVYRIYDSYYGYRYFSDYSEDYWSTFQLDRQLYKPNDIVSFWGFLKERDKEVQVPEEVTVEISSPYYIPLYKSSLIWPGPGYQGSAMEKVTVKVTDGMYQGEIKIPNLQQGGYGITVKDKDTVLARSYITVQDYVKPAYTLEVSSDKKGIKNGEPVVFTIHAAFFEGTPVSDLAIQYNINFYPGNQYVQGEVTTDANGDAKVSFIPDAKDGVQGIYALYFYANAKLPESGEISANHSVMVFVNDIHVQANAYIEKEDKDAPAKGTVEVRVNLIDLDKYNADEKGDYIGAPLKGHKIEGTVLWNTWDRIEVGKYYDYINKVTYPRYEYKLRTETVTTFTMETDKDGIAKTEFTPLDVDEGYYTVNIRTKDRAGRSIKYDNIYVSGSARAYAYYPEQYQYYRLEKDKEQDNYKSGEIVGLTYKYGEKALEGGRFLYVKAARGYLEWDVKDDSRFEFTMEDKYAPNIYVYGVWFNNRVHIVSHQLIIPYDYSDNRLSLTAETDKKTYKPGETVTVKLSSENGAGAIVNLSIVDEALFALNDRYVNTLEQLYRNVSFGLVWEFRSHANSGRDVADGTAWTRDESVSFGLAENKASIAPAAQQETAIREDFKDTAVFKTVRLDENGKGFVSFKLPDNITQWRITLSGVSSDLKAGTEIMQLDVTLPFFINIAASETFLTGDLPVLGVTGYGAELKPGDEITYRVKDNLTGETVATATGRAFERANIQMPELKAGKGEWIVEAVTSTGLRDGISHKFTTFDTYKTMQKADYTELTPYTVLGNYDSRMLTLIFTDRTRGRWLPDLYSLSRSYGNRIEQKLGSRIAQELLEEYFEIEKHDDNVFEAKNYQVSDGGLSILPYGSSDVFVTAWAAAYVKDETDLFRLKEFLYGNLEKETAHASRAAALYGLASLREPVMLELEKLAVKDSLSTEEALYLALSYLSLGEKPVAQKIYNDYVTPALDMYDSYAKIKKDAYMKTGDDVTRTTVLAAVAAARMNLEEAEKFMNYVRMHPTEESLINLQKISYVKEIISRVPGGNPSLTYTWLGEETVREIGPGGMYTLTVPASKAKDFKVTAIEGELGLTVVYETAQTDHVKSDPGITVKRSYKSIKGQAGTMFRSGDIVEVTLEVTITKDAMDNYYKLTDYLPAGLKAIETPIRPYYDAGGYRIIHWYKEIDGQKVSFYVFPYKDQETYTFTYYARIASPGQYKAEGAKVQGVNVIDSTAEAFDQIIYIQP